ncbi:MAG: sigma-54 dependent transcriptional regulator [Candidatus Eisenbacteria bacterium]
MSSILLAWIGRADLEGPRELPESGNGPIAQAMEAFEFDQAWLLCNYADVTSYEAWLKVRTRVPFEIRHVELSSPTEYREIYEAASRACAEVLAVHRGAAQLTFHLSPGTPAMQAMWILIGSTKFRGRFVETSRERGPRVVSIPFEISAELVPDLLAPADRRLERAIDARPPEHPAFSEILFRSRAMREVIDRARRVASRSIPILIEGETGTGKELLARAIHEASPRQANAFIAVNCGAIPKELVEAELFGYEKGAFTGAARRHVGYFEASADGTLFLDEIGELPLNAQVKILRALQEHSVTRVGSTESIPLNLRVIAATNRALGGEVRAGTFRQDLFYRLAVAVLKLPPLREREGDVSLLLERVLDKVNEESAAEGNFQARRLSPAAKNVFLNHAWPGNVRELINTLRRAVVWSEGATIGRQQAQESLMLDAALGAESILGRSLGGGFDLKETLAEVARHYLRRAMSEASGNKTKAAELVGLGSYQTLTGWLDRYGIEDKSNPR